MDAKGYMVMESVWEEVTDNEEGPDMTSNKPQPSTISKQTNKEDNTKEETKQPSKPAPKKADSKPAGGGTQKSMMSFFAKK